MKPPGISLEDRLVAKATNEKGRTSGQTETAPVTTKVPQVPDYELIQRIGHGAYGEVWLARSKATGVLRAAKIVWRHTFADARPYRREFEGIQRFEQISREHPSQLALFHIGRNDAEGYFYYVMELADEMGTRANDGIWERGHAKTASVEDGWQRTKSGREPNQSPHSPAQGFPDSICSYTPHTLRAELEHGRLPAERVLEIGLSLTEALGHLHRHGLVHRDVKPSNVIFVNGRPKLADIGLVTDVSDQCSIVGTEGYLPPEGPGTPQADIFALGKVLYEAATGMDRRKFPDLPAALRDWPDGGAILELNEVVLKACAQPAELRYKTCDRMHDELALVQAGKSVRRARGWEQCRRVVRRAVAWSLAIAAALSLVVLARRTHEPAVVGDEENWSTNNVANYFIRLGLDNFAALNLAEAADCFQKATQADTNCAAAYGYLSSTYSWGGYGEWNPYWVFLPKAKQFAERALSLDQNLAEPHLVLGSYHALVEWNWSEAEKQDLRAIALKPSLPLCYLTYAEHLKMMGRMPEALKEIKKAKARDPHSAIINIRLAHFLREDHQFTNALEEIDNILVQPSYDLCELKQNVLCALGRYGDAIEVERQHRTHSGEPREHFEPELKDLKHAVEVEGPKAYWRRELAKAQTRDDIYLKAYCEAQAGDTNEALALLERACKERNTHLTFMVKTEWMLDPLRKEPRFHAILKTMHLE